MVSLNDTPNYSAKFYFKEIAHIRLPRKMQYPGCTLVVRYPRVWRGTMWCINSVHVCTQYALIKELHTGLLKA